MNDKRDSIKTSSSSSSSSTSTDNESITKYVSSAKTGVVAGADFVDEKKLEDGEKKESSILMKKNENESPTKNKRLFSFNKQKAKTYSLGNNDDNNMISSFLTSSQQQQLQNQTFSLNQSQNNKNNKNLMRQQKR